MADMMTVEITVAFTAKIPKNANIDEAYIDLQLKDVVLHENVGGSIIPSTFEGFETLQVVSLSEEKGN